MSHISDSSNDDDLISNMTETTIDPNLASQRGRCNRSRARRGGRGRSSRGRGRGSPRGRGGTISQKGTTSPLNISHNDVSLFWNVSPDSETPSISVHVSSTPLPNPLVPPDSNELTDHVKFPDVLSYDVTLDDGFYFIYFYQNGCFTLNPAYPVHDTYNHNFFTVAPSELRNQLHLLTGLTPNEALLFQLEFYFSDDNFVVGGGMHSASFKTQTKPARWVPFDFILTFNFFNSLASTYNIDLSAEFLHELTQSSDTIESDLRYGIRRKKASVPTHESLKTRKLAIFPLLSTDEVLDVVHQLHSLDVTTSSFIAYFKEGCKAIRANVTVQDSIDAVMLVQGNSINVNGRDLIVRFEHQFNQNFGSDTSSVASSEADGTRSINIRNRHRRRRARTKTFQQRCRDREKTGLPILTAYDDIIDRMENEKVLVCIAETGSGKTTQLPQFSAEYCFKKFGKGNFKVVCTQPRAIAALSLADFIAMEYDGTKPGNNVGYNVGQKNVNGDEILLTTDGSLIRKAAKDLLLSDVKVLIIDEAHERSLDTDIVLGIAKLILQQRDDFRVIIASATIDPTPFLQFFNGPNVNKNLALRVPGRLFNVGVEEETVNSETLIEDLPQIVCTAMHNPLYYKDRMPNGHVLVFCSGAKEIDMCVAKFKRMILQSSGQLNHIEVLPLHGKLSPDQQQEVLNFDKVVNTDGNYRMVCFCTNVAETSLTVQGIKLVVDTGLAKEARYCPKRRITILQEVFISKSSADQRKGRAGRLSEGHCLRLYNYEEDLERDSIEPEILRSSLDFVVLKLTMLGQNPITFELMDRPDEQDLINSLHLLESFGCIKSYCEVNELGRFFFEQSLDVRLSFFVYLCGCHGYLEEGALIASIISAPGSIFFFGQDTQKQRQEVQTKRKELASNFESDLLFLCSVYSQWKKVADKKMNMAKIYAMENALNNKICTMVRLTTSQVTRNFKNAQLFEEVLSNDRENSDLSNVISGALVRCFSEQICQFLDSSIPGRTDVFLLDSSLKGRIARESCLFSKKPSSNYGVGLSITDNGISAFVNLIHQINSSFIPAKLLDSIQNKSIQLSKESLCCNVGSYYFTHFLRSFRAYQAQQPRNSTVHFVELDYVDANIVATGPADVLRTLKQKCEEEVCNLKASKLQESQVFNFENYSFAIGEGLVLNHLDVPGPTLCLKRPAEERRHEFEEFVNGAIGARLIREITKESKVPIQYSLGRLSRQQLHDHDSQARNKQRGFVTLPPISQDLFASIMNKLVEAGVLKEDVEEAEVKSCKFGSSFVWNTLKDSKEIAQQHNCKTKLLGRSTISGFFYDLPGGTTKKQLDGVINNSNVQVESCGRDNFNTKKGFKVTGSPSHYAVAKQNIMSSHLFQPFQYSFTNPSGRTKTNTATPRLNHELLPQVLLMFSSSNHCHEVFNQLCSQGHDVYFNYHLPLGKLKGLPVSTVSSSLSQYGVTVDTRKGISITSQDLPNFVKACYALDNQIKPIKLTYMAPDQVALIDELIELNLLNQWETEYGVTVHRNFETMGRNRKKHFLTIYGDGMMQGQFLRAINDYAAEFRNRFEIISVNKAQKSLFLGRRGNDRFTQFCKTLKTQQHIDIDIDSISKSISTNLIFSSQLQIYIKPESSINLESVKQFIDNFLLSQGTDVTLDPKSCCFCFKSSTAGNTFFHCGHSFCKGCLVDQINSVFSNGMALDPSFDGLKCPYCDTKISCIDIRRCFDQTSDFFHTIQKAIQCNILSFPGVFPNITVCKKDNCGAIMAKMNTFHSCPQCGSGQCDKCGCVDDVAHSGISCEDYVKLKKSSGNYLERLFKDAEKFVEDLWNITPSLASKCRNPCLLQGCPAIQRFVKTVRKHGVSCLSQVKFAWHGTKAPAVASIAYDGFDPKYRSGQACGPGEYFGVAEKPAVSVGYSSGCRYMFVAAILPLDGVFSERSGFCYVVNNPLDFESTYCLPLLVLEMDRPEIARSQIDWKPVNPVVPVHFEAHSLNTVNNDSDIQCVASWFWQDDSQWERYTDQMSRLIESQYSLACLNESPSSFVATSIVRLRDDVPQDYLINFDDYSQKNMKTSYTRKIKREIVKVDMSPKCTWQYLDQGLWRLYDLHSHKTIDDAYRKYLQSASSSVIKLRFPGRPEEYLINFADGTQLNTESGTRRKIRRIENQAAAAPSLTNFSVNLYELSSVASIEQRVLAKLNDMVSRAASVSQLNLEDNESLTFSFDDSQSAFCLGIPQALDNISVLLNAVVHRELAACDVTIDYGDSDDDMIDSNPRLRRLLSGIPPPDELLNRETILEYFCYVLIWKCNCTIYGGYIRDFIIRNVAANDIDVSCPNDDLDCVIELFKKEVSNSGFNCIVKSTHLVNDVCKRVKVNFGSYSVDVDFTPPNASRRHSDAAPPYVEADVSNLQISKDNYLSFKEPAACATLNLSLANVLEHCLNQEFIFFYDLRNHPNLKHSQSAFCLGIPQALDNISVLLNAVVHRELAACDVTIDYGDSDDDMIDSNPRLRRLLSGIPPPDELLNRETILEYFCYVLIWKCNCTIYGGYIRDFIIRNVAANDIDVSCPNDDLDCVIELFKKEVSNSGFNCIVKSTHLVNDVCKRVKVNFGSYSVDVDFTPPNASRRHSDAAPPYVEADVSNLQISKDNYLSFKEPAACATLNLSLANVLEHCLNQEFIFFYDLRNHPNLKHRLERKFIRGWTLISQIPDEQLDLIQKYKHLYKPIVQL
ncbi:hypothetical protein P9112_003538 [Eukaryota sp. TZLM1-RC]